jgi:hypothetical protein
MRAVGSMKSSSSTASSRPCAVGWRHLRSPRQNELERESGWLKRMYADLSLENVVLKGVTTKEFWRPIIA